MKIIIVILAAALIFLVIKIIRLAVKYLLNRNPRMKILRTILIFTEYLVWLIFVFQAANFLFREAFFYRYLVTGLILVVMGLLTWFFIRDIFAGLIFKIKYSLKTGTYINAGNFNGQIKSQMLTSIQLITNEGLTINVPYTRLINEVITERGFRGTHGEHILQLQVDLSLGRSNAEELVRSALLSTPWSSLKEEPIIRLVNENEKGYFFKITLFSVKMKHIKLIEIALEKEPYLHVISQKQS